MNLINKSISFVKFIENNLGIEYKNNSNLNINAKIKFFDEKSKIVLFEDSFCLHGNGQYFSILTDTKNITGPIIFNVYDENDNLFFSVKNEITDLFIKDREKPKILLKHLICDRKGKKEFLSIENIKSSFSLIENFDYSIKDSKIYDNFPEKNEVFEGNQHWIKLDKKHNEFGLTPRHYGCYKAHIDAILEFFNDQNNYDYLVIAEGDAKILISPEKFKTYFLKAISILEKTNYKIFTFGRSVKEIELNKKVSENMYEIDYMWGTYLYMFSKKHKYYFKYIIDKYGWHAFDWWLNLSFEKEKEKFLKFNTDDISFEFDGYSYIDKVEKKY